MVARLGLVPPTISLDRSPFPASLHSWKLAIGLGGACDVIWRFGDLASFYKVPTNPICRHGALQSADGSVLLGAVLLLQASSSLSINHSNVLELATPHDSAVVGIVVV